MVPDRFSDNMIHVLDLPQLYTHPTATKLLDTLTTLTIKPTAWIPEEGRNTDASGTTSGIDEHGIPSYLTSIISSQLSWIADEQARERIWEEAGSRLSERSGRTAQRTITRTFDIPDLQLDRPPMQIQLVEPSLTADNLGHKTWLASYLLARRLPSLLHYFPGRQQPITMLELGSGTGLLGIAAAALVPFAKTRLTDLPEIIGNLERNVQANSCLFQDRHIPTVGVLDWSIVGDRLANGAYDVILASDPLYSPDHPEWLVQTIVGQLTASSDARVIIELPLREAYLGEIRQMQHKLFDRGLVLLDSGEESGHEDWTTTSCAGSVVPCWWSIWGWSKLSL